MGYPLTRDLFFGLWPRLEGRVKKQLAKVIAFHHPAWDKRSATLPDIEEFLTELTANEHLLPTLAPHGRFGPPELRNVKQSLLLAVARWFHEIYAGRKSTSQGNVKARLLTKIRRSKNAVVISFNWDYELDEGMFGACSDHKSAVLYGYGLEKGATPGPYILKPHGSLNWYLEPLGKRIKTDRSALL